MATRPQIWVGIDGGKTTHHACAVDETGKTVFSQKFANDQAAIEAVIARAGQTADRVRWAIDLTSPLALLLITVLLAADQAVTYVPGRVVNTMTHGFRGEAKTDAKDAKVIAETARMRRDLSQVTMPDELVVGLTQLTSYRTDLMADWVAGINRLRSLLGSIFPALEAAFDFSNRTPLILVAGMCTPAEIRSAGIHGATTYLAENGAWRPGIGKTAVAAVEAAGRQSLALPGEACPASSSWQVFGLGKVGYQGVGGAEVDFGGPVPGDGLVWTDGVVLEPVGIGVFDEGQNIIDLLEEQPLVFQRPEPAFT